MVFKDSLKDYANFKSDTVFLIESFSPDALTTYGSFWADDGRLSVNYRVSASGELEYGQENYSKALRDLFEELKFDSIKEITKSTVYGGDVYLGTVIMNGVDYIHFSFNEPSLEWQRKANGFD